MKAFVRAALLFLWLIFCGGCYTIVTTYYCSLRGTCEVDQPNFVLKISAVNAWYSRNINTFGRTNLVWAAPSLDAGNANGFLLTFVKTNQEKFIDSLHGSYQFKSTSSQPLVLAYFDKQKAVLLLRTNQPAPV